MIKTSSILTNNHKNFEIRQLYFSPSYLLNGTNVLSLYGFLSHIYNKDDVILESTVDETEIVAKCAVNKGSDKVQILNKRALTDFYVGQKLLPTNTTVLNGKTLRDKAFPDDTKVLSKNEEFLELTVSKSANTTYIGNITFKGINQNDLITIKETPELEGKISSEENFYSKYMIFVNVDPTLPPESAITYTKSIIGYSPNSKTLRVESPFDFPYYPLTANSTIKIYSTNLKPGIPIDSDKYIKMVHKNMYYMKKLTSNDFCPVIERVDWKPNTYYAQYKDDIDIYQKNIKYRTSDNFSTGTIPCYTNDGRLFELNSYNLNSVPAVTFDSGIRISPKYNFYVMNSFMQVFKCIWNNNNAKSTIEPYFVPGNFDDKTLIFYSPEDGYKWKYMYTITGDKVKKFLDSKYMPVIVQDEIDIKNNSYGCGGVEGINIVRGGSGYSKSNTVTVVIEGDG